jgi:hypothetical protein
MKSNLSSFSEQYHASDFDENVPFKHQIANFDAISETDKDNNSTLISIRNYNKFASSDQKGIQNHKNKELELESFNVSSDAKQGNLNIKKDIKPFTYKPDTNKYFDNKTQLTSHVVKNSLNKEKFLYVREEGYGNLSHVDSSFVSIPNEDCVYSENEVYNQSSVSNREDQPTFINLESPLNPIDTSNQQDFEDTYEIRHSNKKISTRISPLRKYISRNQTSLNRNQVIPDRIHKTTANFIPSLCPNSKHLTKFDAIYHQKSPSRTVTVEQAEEIGKRLYNGKLNNGK